MYCIEKFLGCPKDSEDDAINSAYHTGGWYGQRGFTDKGDLNCSLMNKWKLPRQVKKPRK